MTYPRQPMGMGILETAGHFIALPLDSGQHQIELIARLSPLRKALLYLNFFLIGCGVLWLWREGRGRGL